MVAIAKVPAREKAANECPNQGETESSPTRSLLSGTDSPFANLNFRPTEIQSSKESLNNFLSEIWEAKDQITSAKQVYRHYAQTKEPNPLSLSAYEFMEGLERIQKTRPSDSHFKIQGMPITLSEAVEYVKDANNPQEQVEVMLRGFYRFGSHCPGDSPPMGRIYINAKADRALDVLQFVVEEFVDNPRYFSSVNSAKIAGPNIIGIRSENILIYMSSKEESDIVLARLANYVRQNPDAFMDNTPPMTQQVARGISYAAEPSANMPRNSFGELRANLIWESLEMERNGSFESFKEIALEMFRQEGISLEHPHLNAD